MGESKFKAELVANGFLYDLGIGAFQTLAVLRFSLSWLPVCRVPLRRPSHERLRPGESEELAAVLKLGERLLDLLIRPERIYVLKFGESDDRIHFHLIPRTAELLKSYLDERQESPPYNGALITAWLWANAGRLGHSDADIQDFISSARRMSEQLTS